MVAGGFPTPHPQLCIVSRNISEGIVISSQTQSERENTLLLSFRAEWGRLSQGRELKIKEVPGSGQGRIWDEISLAPKSIIYILCTLCVYMYVCAHTEVRGQCHGHFFAHGGQRSMSDVLLNFFLSFEAGCCGIFVCTVWRCVTVTGLVEN